MALLCTITQFSSINDYIEIKSGKIEFVRKEKPSAGTKCWLMGLAADIAEVSETLSKEVLERVKKEAYKNAVEERLNA